MSKYIPFLKAKSNETQALEELYKKDATIFTQITPFFDIPRESNNQTMENVLNKAHSFKKRLDNKALFKNMEFYIDNYDLDDEILIDGVEQYEYILSLFRDYLYIPVIGINRLEKHNKSVYDSLSINGGKLAIRLVAEDIESYKITKMHLLKMMAIIRTLKVEQLHLIIDLRYIQPTDIKRLTDMAEYFILNVNKDFHFDKCIISASSIPANISSLLETYQRKSFTRAEWKIWDTLVNEKKIGNIIYGDYGIVSPDYSDIDLDPKLFRKVSAPKVFYTYKNNMFCVRGGSFQNDERGNGQYYDIATIIHDQKFFRATTFSYGEQYVYDRSSYSPKKPDKAGNLSSWIKAMLTSHIKFVLHCIP
ncbi:TPA: beta family protein [Klebsiella quasipneumoniae subsp. similipneumoniae]